MPSETPDLLDRLFRQLVANLAALNPAALHRPFSVADLHEALVPYRTHRVPLGFETSEDYELTVLRLLAGERGYVVVSPTDVREKLRSEIESNNPDTGLFRRFPDAQVLLDMEHVAEVTGVVGTISPEPTAEVSEPQPRPEPAAASSGGDDQLPFTLEEADETRPTAQPRGISHSTPCSYCGGSLPVGRTVLFCPHCGQNVGVVHCPTCDAELDVGWRFCISCGQKVGGLR